MLLNWALILISGAITAAIFGFGTAAVLASDIGQALVLVFVLLLFLFGLREFVIARISTNQPFQGERK